MKEKQLRQQIAMLVWHHLWGKGDRNLYKKIKKVDKLLENIL